MVSDPGPFSPPLWVVEVYLKTLTLALWLEGSTGQMDFLGRPNQLVRAVQLDVNQNWRKLNVDLKKSK